MMPDTIVLRVLSGPHLGAELPLPTGVQVLGGADGCDIILNDATVLPRHAHLMVDNGATGLPLVRIRPLDGPVRIADSAVPADGRELPMLTVCFLGLTSFAWNTPDAPPESWQRVLDVPRREEQETTSELAKLTDGTPTKSAFPMKMPASLPRARRRQTPVRLWLGLFVLIVLLGGLTFSLTPPTLDDAAKVAVLNDKIRELALPALAVSADSEGVRLAGAVLNDAEYVALTTMVQGLHFPVYLDVTVDMDSTNAVRAAFNAHKVYPEVRKAAENTLEVRAYIQDGVLEAEVFHAVRADLPRLRAMLEPGRAHAVIRHADEVRAALAPALAAAGLEFIQVSFLPGTVELSGSLDEAQRGRLQTALADVQRNLDVPVLFTVAEPAPVTAAAEAGKSLDANVIVSVAMSPMRFVTLGNGERIFEGGMMPDGSRLETISPQALLLLKDGRITTYPLRGSP